MWKVRICEYFPNFNCQILFFKKRLECGYHSNQNLDVFDLESPKLKTRHPPRSKTIPNVSSRLYLLNSTNVQISEMDPDKMVEDSEVDIISVSNISKRYISVKLLGKGGFGKVYKCLSLETKELVALKAVQENYGKRELDTLKALRELDQDKNNLVRFYKHHEQRGMVYLEFELLDITIYEYMDKSGRPLLLSEIQVITQQMLVALNALKSISLVHADIKPNNIMLVNHKLQPMKVKLIDFGLTIPVNTVTRKNFQVLHFRAPEVMLGLPLNEATDMWCLGSVLAYMYLGQSLHTQGQCKYLTMKKIVEMHGQPAYYMLKNGKYTKEYFLKDSYDSSWCYEGSRIPSFDTMEYEETQVFSSLLKQMLEVDPEKRITPSEALQHPFMTLKHFHKKQIIIVQFLVSTYLKSVKLMIMC
uniref:Protein kinase domain-containing protein n=1 Tax=Scophthalmus maximus TaxID=52904 RepID=A0A8D2ZNU7_SCOMX